MTLADVLHLHMPHNAVLLALLDIQDSLNHIYRNTPATPQTLAKAHNLVFSRLKYYGQEHQFDPGLWILYTNITQDGTLVFDVTLPKQQY